MGVWIRVGGYDGGSGSGAAAVAAGGAPPRLVKFFLTDDELAELDEAAIAADR